MVSKSLCKSSLVIFGGLGDLSLRKLLPAIFKLYDASLLNENFALILTGRKVHSIDEVLNLIKSKIETKNESNYINGFEKLKDKIFYFQLDPTNKESIQSFYNSLKIFTTKKFAPPRLYYFAIPPDTVLNFLEVVKPLMAANSYTCPPKLILEKPFGIDLKSAQTLNSKLLEVLDEKQIYRIDHYLGKEGVQNILAVRFANLILEPIWNNKYIDHVQISFSETIGVENRAEYFDKTGILKDVVQNHLLQVLCLVAMEPPANYSNFSIQQEKIKVLECVRKLNDDEINKYTVRAQYDVPITSEISLTTKNQEFLPYIKERGVQINSKTETYAALKLFIDNWRWYNVPFYLRAGKRLKTNKTEVLIFFKKIPIFLFDKTKADCTTSDICKCYQNVLKIKIQPDEGINLIVNSKLPGLDFKLIPIHLDFSYKNSFDTTIRFEAYERLLLDALYEDNTLFINQKEIELAWKIIDPIIENWEYQNKKINNLETYPSFSNGPISAERLIQDDGREWFEL